MINYWLLAGIGLVILGFALRFNPLLVVATSAIATGLLAGMDFLEVLRGLGKGFNDNRYITAIYVVVPVIALLERYGLQHRAKALIAGMKRVRVGRLLTFYLGFRQIFAALGLTHVAGHAQTVRPLVAPMAEAAAEKAHGELSEEEIEKIKAMAAATDNIGLFFGEDIFIAIASILLIQGSMATYGIELTPLQLSVWAIPTAIAAFIIHSARLALLDRKLGKVSQ